MLKLNAGIVFASMCSIKANFFESAGVGYVGIDSDPTIFTVARPLQLGHNNFDFTLGGTPLVGTTAALSVAAFADNIGIDNSAPRGYGAFSGGSTATNATLQSIYYQVAGTFVAGNEQLLTLSGNEITNNSGRVLVCNIRASSGGTTSSPSDRWSLAIIKNGGATVNPAALGGAVIVGALTWTANNTDWSGFSNGQTTLQPGDKVRLYIANVSAAAKSYTAASAVLVVDVTSA